MTEAPRTTFKCRVTEVRLESASAGRQLWQVALDQTMFTPGDSGELLAVARSGARLLLTVLRVDLELSGTVWHLVDKPVAEGTELTASVIRPALL